MDCVKKSFSIVIMLLLCIMMVFPSDYVCAASDGIPFGLVLSWTEDPATSITAVWRDDEEKAEYLQVVSELDYNTSGFETAVTAEAACWDISLDLTGVWHYEATVTGLTPDTVYCYRVGGGDAWSEVRTFRTDDPRSEAVTFAYMGDVQTAGVMEEDYALWGELCAALYERNPELSFAVLGGDLVNSGISPKMFDCFFQNASPVFSQVPLYSTVGNHESNIPGGKPELFRDYFAFPTNGPEGFAEEFFSLDVGNVHLLVLNDWIFSGEQNLSEADFARVADWIRFDLAASTADWQVVVLHVPVYEVHSDTRATAVREAWGGIFEDYGVDLVFEGHQHVYSRCYPMYRERIDYEKGVTYIMGVAGSKFYDSSDETLAERVVYNTATYELVRTDGDTMTVQAVDLMGNELDYAVIPQRSVRVTRGEYVETLWKAAGSPAPQSTSPFTDTDSEAVTWAYELGLVQGCGGGRFIPEMQITEEQIGIILDRAKAVQNGPVARLTFIERLWAEAGSPAPQGASPFTDTDNPAVTWAYEAGYVQGYGGGLFGPDDLMLGWQIQLLAERMGK